jgi:GTPase Era involved in 16S rRNA processing
MATATGKTRCIICSKEKATIKCGGCQKDFCYKHWEPHRQELNKQLDEIEVNRDLFRQSLTQQTKQPDNHIILIQQIDQWEQKSMRIIEQVAEEARKTVLKTTNENIHQMEERLGKLTTQLRQSREDDDVNEISLHQFQEELERLNKELTKPRNISIREDSTSFISKIYVDVSDNSFTSIPNGEN